MRINIFLVHKGTLLWLVSIYKNFHRVLTVLQITAMDVMTEGVEEGVHVLAGVTVVLHLAPKQTPVFRASPVELVRWAQEEEAHAQTTTVTAQHQEQVNQPWMVRVQSLVYPAVVVRPRNSESLDVVAGDLQPGMASHPKVPPLLLTMLQEKEARVVARTEVRTKLLKMSNKNRSSMGNNQYKVKQVWN